MDYRKLGSTSLEVSALSLGTAPLSGRFRQVEVSTALQTLYTAVDLGINLIAIDAPEAGTAEGADAVDEVIGRALRNLPRDAFRLAVTTGLGTAGEDVAREIERRLVALGVDHFDLALVATEGDQPIADETIGALGDAVEAGKVNHIGAAGGSLPALLAAAEIPAVGAVLACSRYTLLDDSLAPHLPRLAGAGAGVLAAAPLHRGLLNLRDTPEGHPADPEVVARCAEAAHHCVLEGVDLAQLAIQYAVDLPGVATTVTGSANPEDLRRSVSWIRDQPDAELLREALGILRRE